MLSQSLLHAENGKADDVFEGPLVFGNQSPIIFLCGVPAGFVQGIDPLEILENHLIGELAKLHPAHVHES